MFCVCSISFVFSVELWFAQGQGRRVIGCLYFSLEVRLLPYSDSVDLNYWGTTNGARNIYIYFIKLFIVSILHDMGVSMVFSSWATAFLLKIPQNTLLLCQPYLILLADNHDTSRTLYPSPYPISPSLSKQNWLRYVRARWGRFGWMDINGELKDLWSANQIYSGSMEKVANVDSTKYLYYHSCPSHPPPPPPSPVGPHVQCSSPPIIHLELQLAFKKLQFLESCLFA